MPKEIIKIIDEPSVNEVALNGHQNDTIVEQAAVEVVPVDRNLLYKGIQEHFKAIGLNGNQTRDNLAKDAVRQIHRLHREAAQYRINLALGNKFENLLQEIANGDEVEPDNIRPQLIRVRSGTQAADLFRFASLQWSIPVSQGYGRRLRYLVKDRTNNKLIGLFALGDPVFNLRVRDEWINWNQADRREKLVNVMDAYVLGAVPPYAKLLGGKLVASLIASQEVADEFKEQYGSRTGILSGKQKHARLGLVTVTSALGRSSLYNRLRLMSSSGCKTSKPVVELLKLGTTVGYGHFQITDELFLKLREVLQEDGHKYADGHRFGDGPNWRIRVLRAGLQVIGLPPNNILRHGIKREVYVMPLAQNTQAFLSGRDAKLKFDHRSVEEIATLARDRWIIPRAERKPEYRHFRREQFLPPELVAISPS